MKKSILFLYLLLFINTSNKCSSPEVQAHKMDRQASFVVQGSNPDSVAVHTRILRKSVQVHDAEQKKKLEELRNKKREEHKLAQMQRKVQRTRRLIMGSVLKSVVLNTREFINASKIGDIAKMEKIFEMDKVVLNQKNECGNSALMIAALHGKKEAVRYLLTVGADVNLRGCAGCTALMLAVQSTSLPTFKELLDYELTDLTFRDFNGKSARDFAKDYRNKEMIDAFNKAFDARCKRAKENGGNAAMQTNLEIFLKEEREIAEREKMYERDRANSTICLIQ